MLPTTQQHLGAAYYPAASRCCRLLPSSIPVLPTNSLPTCRRLALPYPQHQHPIHMPGAAYPPASRCCPLPNSISVLPTTKQHLGAAAYHQAAPQCCLLITYPQHLGAAHDRHARSITVLPTTSLCLQHLSAAYPTASWCCQPACCCMLVLTINNLPQLPSCPQHLSTASHKPHSISVLHAYS